MAKIHNHPTLIAFSLATLLGALGACAVKVQAGGGANSEDDAANQTATATAEASSSAPAATQEPTATAQPAETAPAATTAPSAAPTATETTPAPTTTTPAAPPPNPIVRKAAKINLPSAFAFDAGQATLSADPVNEQLLTQLAEFLKKKPEITQMRIEGHTDAAGDAAANLKLSGDRALAIKTALVAKGVKAERLVAVGFGGTKPIADASAQGQAQNERLQFRVATLKGRRYLGLDPLGGGTEFK